MKVKFYRNGRLVEDEYTAEELSALNEKDCHPEKEIICPRCGKALLYEEKGNSSAVTCPTKDCIFESFRGL